MARDIEEFLRKAAERRQQQKGGAPQQSRQPRPPQQQPPQRQPPQRQPPQRAQEPFIIADAVEAEIIEARPARRLSQSPRKKSSIRDESVADHVKSHINTSDIAEHATSLGERITNVHDRIDAQIHQRLDHDLSVIDDTPTVTDDPPPAIFGARNNNAAVELHRLLQNPKSVGQAILIAEILKRPNFG